jgi:hypothetical protein
MIFLPETLGVNSPETVGDLIAMENQMAADRKKKGCCK